ncbi:MAG: [LysW]-aminoadipate/[LysW]-glutamate kinase [Candidatus Bathyarchaeota archaeon]|nr:[LysW]-aminoadipate/[LysW]-glutamate kinase [Candidatus Bathyarchaeota archaeon]
MLIVVKVGGSILKEVPPEIVSDIKKVLDEGNQLVLVHGGGKGVTAVASKLGKEQKFVYSPQGFRSRYTDKETMEIFTMVMAGKINKSLVSALQKQEIPIVGLSGLDGFLLRAERKKRLIIVNEQGRKQVIDGGYTGKVKEVNASLLKLLVDNGYVPLVSPVAVSEEYEPLNVDADRTAANIAGALKADKLVLLTDVDGLMFNDKVVPQLSIDDVDEKLKKIGGGMITKVFAAKEALKDGVGEVVICSGVRASPISSALKHEGGTVISRE